MAKCLCGASTSTAPNPLVESFPLVRALQDHLAQLSRCYDVPIIENRSLRTTVDGILASLPDSEHRRD